MSATNDDIAPMTRLAVTTAGAETAAVTTTVVTAVHPSPPRHDTDHPGSHRQMTSTMIVTVDNHDVIEMHPLNDDDDLVP